MDDQGPLDFLVFELPAGSRSYPGNVVREVIRLSEAEFIRVVRLAVVSKDLDGGLAVGDSGDVSGWDGGLTVGDSGEVRGWDGRLTVGDPGDAGGAGSPLAPLVRRLLAEDLGQAAVGLPPGRMMGVLVYESLWANPLASAVRRSGGEWMGRGRL
jgi:hypothetical protein